MVLLNSVYDLWGSCWFQIQMPFPAEGQVYDYRLDDAGLTLPPQDDDEEETLRANKVSAGSSEDVHLHSD